MPLSFLHLKSVMHTLMCSYMPFVCHYTPLISPLYALFASYQQSDWLRVPTTDYEHVTTQSVLNPEFLPYNPLKKYLYPKNRQIS